MDEYRRNVKQRDFLHKHLLCGFCQDGSKTASREGKMIRIRKLELLPVTYLGSSLTASLIFLLFWPCSFRYALTSPCQMHQFTELLHAFDLKRFNYSWSKVDPIKDLIFEKILQDIEKFPHLKLIRQDETSKSQKWAWKDLSALSSQVWGKAMKWHLVHCLVRREEEQTLNRRTIDID